MRVRLCSLVVMGLILVVTDLAHAGAPALITYQGALTDAAGNPANGTLPMAFSMYPRARGGAPVWTETIASVKVTDGVFTVVLGGSTPLPANLDRCRFLEVAVGGTPMRPRQRLTSVLFALEAAKAASVSGVISENCLPQNAIDSSEIENGSITRNDLGRASVVGRHLSSGAVSTGKIRAGAVTTTRIADGAVTGLKVADGTLGGLDLSPGAVGTGQLGDNAVTTGKIALDTIVAADIAPNAVEASELANNSVDTGALQGNAVTGAKIGPGAVGTGQLGDNAVTTAKIALDTIVAADIAPNAVEASELADGSVDTGALKGNAVTSAKIADGTVTSADVEDDTLTSADIGFNAVQKQELADDAVDTEAIDDKAVTTAKIGDWAVGSEQLGFRAVTGSKIHIPSEVKGSSQGSYVLKLYNEASNNGSHALVAWTDGTNVSHGVQGVAMKSSGNSVGVYGEASSASGYAVQAHNTNSSGHGLYVSNGKTWLVGPVRIDSTLDVYGYATFHGGHGDLAENYRAADSAEAGDVVVISANGTLVKCTRERETAVAGIVSTQPSMKLQGRIEDNEDVVPLALVGRVLCKVDATDHPIKAGDLLTTSATPGHAMKALTPRRCVGAIIGKALEDLDSGTGKIQVLVTLR